MPVARLTNTFENFDLARNPALAPAVEAARRVADGEHWCALLVGRYGNGKTHLAIAAFLRFLDAGRGFGWFWKVPDFLSWVKHEAYDEGRPIDAVLGSLQAGYGLLVFDDLGAENATDWANEQLYRVLDARYEASLPTILTTNVTKERLDPRVFSRYRSGLVVCAGEDLR